MMTINPLRILLIDNEELIRREASEDLTGQLKEGGLSAIVDAVGTMNEAVKKLEDEDFHTAIVDLRLAERSRGGK